MSETPAPPQNVYDDPTFFAGYEALRRSEAGLNAAIERPALASLLPPLDGLAVLDLGCGLGDFCRTAVDGGAERVLGLDVSERMVERVL